MIGRSLMAKSHAAWFGSPLIAVGLIAAGMAAADTPLAGTEGVDRSVRPGDDFYRYANNAWLGATRLPDGASRIDTSAQLRAENARRVRALVDEAVARPVTPAGRKIADYYLSRMDKTAINAKGLAPVAGDLAAISAIADRPALARWLGRTV